jgi:hypothetical protein
MKKKTKYQFKQDLRRLAEECASLSASTAQKKASALIKKYDALFQDWEGQNNELYEWLNEKRDIISALKTGVIKFRKNGIKCTLSIKNLQAVSLGPDSVNLEFENGQKITLSKDFEYLQEVL